MNETQEAQAIRHPLAAMRAKAQRIVDKLAPHCARIEIGGSIRRGAATVKDIELVAIPTLQPDLFGEEHPDAHGLNLLLASWQRGGQITLEKDGDRYKRFSFATSTQGIIAVDLFLATPATFGYIAMLRTGPWEFSKRMVTSKASGGLKPEHITVADGAVWRGDTQIAVPEEVDLFNLYGLAYIPPEERA